MRKMLATVTMLIALVFSPTLPTHATEGILLSKDGSSWSETLTAPLFDESLRWVPGDERTATFYVRNDTDLAAAMSVDILAGELEALLETGDIYIDARIDGGPWRTTQTTGTYQLTQDGVAPGDSYPVDVRVRFDAASLNDSQQLSFDFDVRVTLVQLDDPTTDPVLPNSDPNRPLAQTGAAVRISVIAIAGLVGVVLALIAGRRRREEAEASYERS